MSPLNEDLNMSDDLSGAFKNADLLLLGLCKGDLVTLSSPLDKLLFSIQLQLFHQFRPKPMQLKLGLIQLLSRTKK